MSTESGPSSRSGNTRAPEQPRVDHRTSLSGSAGPDPASERALDMRPLLLALTLVPAAVQAAPVLVPLSRGIELRTQALADPASADLVVQSRLLAARYGIRCVSGDAFGPSPGGDRRSLRGAGWLRRDLRGQGDRREQRLGGPRRPPDRHPRAGAPAAPFEALPADPEAGVLARYQMTGYSIDGSPVTTTYASLVVRADGSYSFGERRAAGRSCRA